MFRDVRTPRAVNLNRRLILLSNFSNLSIFQPSSTLNFLKVYKGKLFRKCVVPSRMLGLRCRSSNFQKVAIRTGTTRASQPAPCRELLLPCRSGWRRQAACHKHKLEGRSGTNLITRIRFRSPAPTSLYIKTVNLLAATLLYMSKIPAKGSHSNPRPNKGV